MDAGVVLVTGASGFVGQHLLARLAGEGRAVVAQHRSPLPPELPAKFGTAVRWYGADIAADDLAPMLSGVATVFHLAADVTLTEGEAEVARMREVNVEGTRRLAVAAKAGGARHFIFVSSIAAGETGPGPEVDEDNGSPRSSYGKSKRAAEAALLALAGTDFAVTVLRPTALFGEDHLGSLYELVRVISQQRFVVIGPGTNRTNFYYIADFVDLLIAIENDARAFGETFIASDAPRPLQLLVDDICRLLGMSNAVRHLPRWLGYLLGWVCDCIASCLRRPMPLSVRRVRAMTRDVSYRSDKLARILGLRPGHGLTEGLRRSIDWYRRAGLL